VAAFERSLGAVPRIPAQHDLFEGLWTGALVTDMSCMRNFGALFGYASACAAGSAAIGSYCLVFPSSARNRDCPQPVSHHRYLESFRQPAAQLLPLRCWRCSPQVLILPGSSLVWTVMVLRLRHAIVAQIIWMCSIIRTADPKQYSNNRAPAHALALAIVFLPTKRYLCWTPSHTLVRLLLRASTFCNGQCGECAVRLDEQALRNWSPWRHLWF